MTAHPHDLFSSLGRIEQAHLSELLLLGLQPACCRGRPVDCADISAGQDGARAWPVFPVNPALGLIVADVVCSQDRPPRALTYLGDGPVLPGSLSYGSS